MSETEDTLAEGTGSVGRRLSDAEFAEAKELYELGQLGLVELADKYGVSRQALSKRLKGAGAVKGSRAHEIAAAASAAAKSAAASSAAAVAERFADKRAEWIEETRLEGVQALKQARLLARKTVADQLRLGSTGAAAPMAAIDDDLKAIARFNKILIDNISEALRILKSDELIEEDNLPTLQISDLTDAEILDHHKATGALPEDATIEDMLSETLEVEV
jgi:prophage DNA circulation protein